VLGRIDRLRAKFTRLHEVVVQAMKNEKTLSDKAKELKDELKSKKQHLEKVSVQQVETVQARDRLAKTLEDVRTT